MSSADNFCKQLWPRSCPTKRIIEIIFWTSWFWKKSKKGFDNAIIAGGGIFCDNIYIYALAQIACKLSGMTGTWLYGLHVNNANPADLSDSFKFIYGHAEVFITELRIEHSLQSNFVRFLCDLKVGQALFPRLIPGLRSISAWNIGDVFLKFVCLKVIAKSPCQSCWSVMLIQ